MIPWRGHWDVLAGATVISWRGPAPLPGRGASQNPIAGQGRLTMAGASPATSPSQAGAQAKNPISGQGRLTMAGASPATSPFPAGAQAKNSHCRQGSFADGKGLTGNEPIPGRDASKKSNFRQGSFAESHFRQGSFAEGKQVQVLINSLYIFGNLWGGPRSSPQKPNMQGNQSPQGQNERK